MSSKISKNIIIINNIDLYNNKYTIYDLENNINNLNLCAILQTQVLTIEFCAKYLLDFNEAYAKDEEDKDLCVKDVLIWQKNINEKDLYDYLGIKKNNEIQ